MNNRDDSTARMIRAANEHESFLGELLGPKPRRVLIVHVSEAEQFAIRAWLDRAFGDDDE